MSFPEFMELFRGMTIEQAFQESGLTIDQALSLLNSYSSGAHGVRNGM